MKLKLILSTLRMSNILVVLLSVMVFTRAYDSEVSNEDVDDGTNLAGGDGLNRNCVFLGCSCGEDENYANTETDPGNENNNAYAQGYDVLCRIDSQDEGGPLRSFPERDTSKPYSNIISSIEASSSNIEDIPAGRFENLEITVADFQRNALQSLSADVFRDIVKLDVLLLAGNRLNNLDEDVFIPIKSSLIQLKLSDNNLHQMNAEKLTRVLSNLEILKSLMLRNNQLEHLPDLSAMSKLEELDLAHNKLASIYDQQQDKQLLPGTISDLNLEHNRLTHVKANTFSNLNNLKYLNLESNEIETIDEDAFTHLTRLSTLNLGKNQIKHIPPLIIYTLINLDRLDLSGQKQMLKEIDDYAFDRSSNAQIIRKIDLSKNRIAKLSNRAFCSRNRTYPYVNVREIDLAANPLNTLNACILRQLSKGFSDFQQLKISQSIPIAGQQHQQQQQQKPKVSFKPTHFAEKIFPLVKCDCEVTKSLNYVDIDGECDLSGGSVDLKNFHCSSSVDLTKESVEMECSSQTEFDCLHQENQSGAEKEDESAAAATSDKPPTNNEHQPRPEPENIKPTKPADNSNSNNNNNNNSGSDKSNPEPNKQPVSPGNSANRRPYTTTLVIPFTLLISSIAVIFKLN